MQETKKLNLLIVEDHALTLFGLKTILNTKEFISEVFEAQNALKALSILEKNKIDIAIVAEKRMKIKRYLQKCSFL